MFNLVSFCFWFVCFASFCFFALFCLCVLYFMFYVKFCCFVFNTLLFIKIHLRHVFIDKMNSYYFALENAKNMNLNPDHKSRFVRVALLYVHFVQF